MASLVVQCPIHGTESTTHTLVGGKPGVEWNYTFPCCDASVKISTRRASSPALPDTPIVPTQRESHHF